MNVSPLPISRQTSYDALPEFLSPEEFREYVGIGRSTVYDLIRQHAIPHCRFGRVIRIPKTALKAMQADEGD